jgi:hypothetical protein
LAAPDGARPRKAGVDDAQHDDEEKGPEKERHALTLPAAHELGGSRTLGYDG